MSPRCLSILVIGGARSGKSRHAGELALRSGLAPVLVATAQGLDAEMEQRIARHREERAPGWQVIEEPLELAACLAAEAGPGRILVVDCLTLWLTNWMLAGRDDDAVVSTLTGALAQLAGPVILVSNEVGAGIVPDNELARRFRDAQGRLNQAVASACDRVTLVCAGLPLVLKPAPAPEQPF
jgi:adenosylcobinamide kinase/adenosylcobinamide-phosphate guanylyltransferase